MSVARTLLGRALSRKATPVPRARRKRYGIERKVNRSPFVVRRNTPRLNHCVTDGLKLRLATSVPHDADGITAVPACGKFANMAEEAALVAADVRDHGERSFRAEALCHLAPQRAKKPDNSCATKPRQPVCYRHIKWALLSA